MTLSQLRTFTAVARHGSMTAAARELGVSVPAVSAALASLRKEFGDELVIRSEGGTALTQGGLRLAAAAAEMVAIADQARRAVQEAREGSSVLRIAATNEIGEYAIGPLVDSFRQGRPRLRVAVTTAPALELESMLRDRRADVVLGPRLIGPDITCHPFLRVKTIVVAGPGHHLADLNSVDPLLLRNEPWLVGPGGSDPDTPLALAARALRIPLERIREEPSHAGAAMAIEMGRGIGPAQCVCGRCQQYSDLFRIFRITTTRTGPWIGRLFAGLAGGVVPQSCFRFGGPGPDSYFEMSANV